MQKRIFDFEERLIMSEGIGDKYDIEVRPRDHSVDTSKMLKDVKGEK